jgi:hypothetical protein
LAEAGFDGVETVHGVAIASPTTCCADEMKPRARPFTLMRRVVWTAPNRGTAFHIALSDSAPLQRSGAEAVHQV